ncbi:MAG TPA: aminoacyl-tRNA hydrolase [Steroidobacteraceae bacterium]|nr:aminoacyl-tRNA hydrolase [Steroidobacteraceae bacterium]
MPGPAIRLIVGLGNPGREYETTRHNAGFWLVEELARRHGGSFRPEARFKAELARVELAGGERWLVKPQDYMNNSGRVTAAVAAFYKVESTAILVAHDELDLAPGDLRLKHGGGAGGHNGLKDLIAHCGADFWRLRIGVGHPGAKELVNPYLLGATRAGERAPIELAVRQGADILPELLETGAERAMQKLHTRGAAE